MTTSGCSAAQISVSLPIFASLFLLYPLATLQISLVSSQIIILFFISIYYYFINSQGSSTLNSTGYVNFYHHIRFLLEKNYEYKIAKQIMKVIIIKVPNCNYFLTVNNYFP